MQPTPPPSRRPGRVPTIELARHDAALVDASGRLFRAYGYAGVSIDMIARAAQVSPKTIYARYGGKLGLLHAVVEKAVELPLASFDALADRQDHSAAILRRIAESLLDRVLDSEVLALERVLIAEAVQLPDLARSFYVRGPVEAVARLADWLRAQDGMGQLRVPDPIRSAEAFISLVEGELVRRALLLAERPAAEERGRWTEFAVTLFVNAHASPGDGTDETHAP